MAENLEEYHQKRNFEKTTEPEGVAAESSEGLRFVVQHHMARRDHYDFRLEWNGVLLSWAVPKGPSLDTRDKRLAVMVEEHPLEYRNFEGTIPKGEYGGGAVMLWDEGFWEPAGNVDEGLSQGALKFTLQGRRLKGKWALVRLKAKEGEAKDNWLLLKEKDEYAMSGEELTDQATSIRTGRTMAEIEAGEEKSLKSNAFSKIDVQLAKLVSEVPKEGDWLYELKYDGYRILAYMEGGAVRLITRNGGDYTHRFQSVASSLADWAGLRAIVLDGEMVVTDSEGRTDFQALQSYMKSPKGKSLTYIVFDLLALEGEDLRSEPLIKRKEMLEALLKDAPKNLFYSGHVRGGGEESFCAACRAELEGIVGKKADSVYSGTRNGDWIKLKCDKRQELVIGGYTLSEKKTRGVSSLLLGAYRKGELRYAGRAGTGLSESNARELLLKFEGLERAQSPFTPAPGAKSGEVIVWLEPELVAEVKFAQWTEENYLRQASFKGLREDKDPRDVKIEKADGETESSAPEEKEEKRMETSDGSIVIGGVRISSPDKVMFEDPDITKAQVVRYYEQVSGRMLPYVSHRILSIVRCPKGVSQACFYKKHPGPGSQGVITVAVPTEGGEAEEYFYIDSTSGLLSEVQMGTLEFHIWGSRADELEKPNMLVFDLDPDEGMELDTVRQGVRDLKSILAELSLQSYLKTSGGKGYHVVVPLLPAVGWEAFHDFARRVAEVMEQKWPDRYTSNVRKAKRTDKIFIDWMRNGRGATSVAPYSLRARKGARVSMPIAWEELDAITPDGITMEDALTRVALSDPWEGYFGTNQLLR